MFLHPVKLRSESPKIETPIFDGNDVDIGEVWFLELICEINNQSWGGKCRTICYYALWRWVEGFRGQEAVKNGLRYRLGRAAS